jgi:hypothetical protein
MKSFKPSGYFLLFMSLMAIILITGCAKNEPVSQCLTGHTYGFLGGLWHGFIAPFDFIGMLFNKDITMYAQNNNGGLYALGFLIGGGGWGFFGGHGVRKVRHTHTHIHVGDDRKIQDAEIID